MARYTTESIRKLKNNQKIACLTAYGAPIAKVLDLHVDLLLVGDTVGMVLYGMDSTLPVTVPMMVAHGKAVVNASKQACVVVDMPFASYQTSKEQAYKNAAKIMAQTGCQAIKLEGGQIMAPTITFLVERGIPVMAHVGMMPQHMNAYGGFKKQGKTTEAAKQVLRDARAVEDAGAFAVVLECIPAKLADEVTESLTIPTIGIGASDNCDGQVLVTEDMVGLSGDNVPSFVKQRAQLGKEVAAAAKAYAADIKSK